MQPFVLSLPESGDQLLNCKRTFAPRCRTKRLCCPIILYSLLPRNISPRKPLLHTCTHLLKYRPYALNYKGVEKYFKTTQKQLVSCKGFEVTKSDRTMEDIDINSGLLEQFDCSNMSKVLHFMYLN